MLVRDILEVVRNTDVHIGQYREGAMHMIQIVPFTVHIETYMQILDLYGDNPVLYLYVDNDILNIII